MKTGKKRIASREKWQPVVKMAKYEMKMKITKIYGSCGINAGNS
jgi:hypothetical protein